MSEETCQSCGRPLQRQPGRRGRASVYCSAACRQKAYRSRSASPVDTAVHDLIADIGQRVSRLRPQLPEPFYTDVTALSGSVGRLRRIARTAVDAARDTVDTPVAHAAPAVPGDRADQTGQPEPAQPVGDEAEPVGPAEVAAATVVRAGDEWEFAGLAERYRRELHVHCYRMVGSYDDSEDLVQETLLRAWRGRDSFEGRSTVRAWLYRIATNVCLDFLRRNTRTPDRYERLPGIESGDAPPPVRVTWLQPYPDELLDDLPSEEAGPDAAAVSRETIELVFLTAIQHLPPRQRAVLIMRDVLGWPAADTAAALDLTVASVNSALQRARPTLRSHLPERRTEWTVTAEPSREEREILRRYVEAALAADTTAMAELLSRDAVLTMPPNPLWFVGRDAIIASLRPVFDRTSPLYFGRWKHLPTRANRQPAFAGYVQRPGTHVYRAQVLDVLRIEGGEIVQITSFEPHLFPVFGLPLTV